jgi:hypothetical protein
MLIALLAAAAAQTAPVAEAKPAPNAQPDIRALACQAPPPRPQPVAGVRSNPLHKLAQEPDAALLRPVVRINHCNETDVLRVNVSSRPANAAPDGQNAPQQRGR